MKPNSISARSWNHSPAARTARPEGGIASQDAPCNPVPLPHASRRAELGEAFENSADGAGDSFVGNGLLAVWVRRTVLSKKIIGGIHLTQLTPTDCVLVGGVFSAWPAMTRYGSGAVASACSIRR